MWQRDVWAVVSKLPHGFWASHIARKQVQEGPPRLAPQRSALAPEWPCIMRWSAQLLNPNASLRLVFLGQRAQPVHRLKSCAEAASWKFLQFVPWGNRSPPQADLLGRTSSPAAMLQEVLRILRNAPQQAADILDAKGALPSLLSLHAADLFWRDVRISALREQSDELASDVSALT